MELTNKVAVVTGAGSGLGAHVALGLAEAGAHLVVADRDLAAARSICDGLAARGSRCMAVACDILDDGDLDRLVTAASTFGPVATLVNNAGGWCGFDSHYPDLAEEDWSAVLRLNLIAPMALTQRLLPAMRSHGQGAVVNIASSAGVETSAYPSPEYAAAKAGLVRLTSSLAHLADEGVRVSCVVPGWIGLSRAVAEWASLPPAEQNARPRLVPPSLITDQVVHLAEDDTSAGRVVLLLDGTTVSEQAA